MTLINQLYQRAEYARFAKMELKEKLILLDELWGKTEPDDEISRAHINGMLVALTMDQKMHPYRSRICFCRTCVKVE